MSLLIQNLTIRPESIQSLYASYLSGGFLVNRRYQRKLVWTVDEKRAFVDSLRRGFPVPLFLFAELPLAGSTIFEIIDGMQRLNAMFAFLEGEFDVDGAYFDMQTIPETKLQLESGRLQQAQPVMSADDCRKVVTYQVPLSVARQKSDDEIDEIFRRINSYGKHLSRQELRQAGSTGHFAELVRKTSARIRGDVSATDRLDLAKMKEISITNRALSYGIEVQKIFWVENRILTPDQVRESRDEELIADMLSYVLLDPKPPSRNDVLNEFYGDFRTEEGKGRFEELERSVQKHTETALVARYMRVHDELREVLIVSGKPFNQLMFEGAGVRVPRYYQVVFLALYDLLIVEGKRVYSRKQLAKLLDGIGEHIQISEGGKWAATERETNVDAVKGIVGKAFRKSKENDPAYDSWVTEFENILTQSATENNLYDWKQGVHRLVSPFEYDDDVLPQVAKTLSAMANLGPGSVGYVMIGVTDDSATSARVEATHNIAAKKFRRFRVFGVDHEAALPIYKKGLDSYFQHVQQQIRQQPLTGAYRDQILSEMRLFQYFDRHVVLLKVVALHEPCAFGGEYYQRSGANVDKIEGERLKQLFRRFFAA